jgi:mRNA interferase RelE/StbE
VTAHRVVVKRRAQKEIANLEPKTRKLVLRWIEANLEGSENPREVPGSKKLQGVRGGWRWRLGAYRILGVIDGEILTIELFRIGHRRDVNRNLA